MTDKKKSADEGAGKEEEEGGVEEWDQARAEKTIKDQRASEKAALKNAADLAKRLKVFEDAEAAKEEEEKDSVQKLADSEALVKKLRGEAAESTVKADFLAEAGERGYEDLGLAYLAAKDAGILGELDPETGKVEAHNFDDLEEAFPGFKPEDEDDRQVFRSRSGDAGVRTRKPKKNVNDQFNAAIGEILK